MSLVPPNKFKFWFSYNRNYRKNVRASQYLFLRAYLISLNIFFWYKGCVLKIKFKTKKDLQSPIENLI